MVQISKNPFMMEGFNIVFLDIGVLIDMLSENARPNCAQIFKESLTTGFIEYFNTDSDNGSLEKSQACKETGPHDKLSN